MGNSVCVYNKSGGGQYIKRVSADNCEPNIKINSPMQTLAS